MLTRTGGCFCGSVRFAVELTDEEVVACHCSQCHRITGHYWAYVSAQRDRISFQRDATLRWLPLASGTERGSCSECGSALFRRRPDEASVAISAGSLDDQTGLALVAHEFTSGCPDYYPLPTRAPCYEGQRGVGARVIMPPKLRARRMPSRKRTA